MAQTPEEKRAYSRGYNRCHARAHARAQECLRIAQGYRLRLRVDDEIAQSCDNCDRWTRGGENCAWGHCRADFQYGAGEGRMWADTNVGQPRVRICTSENFGCHNFIPRK